MRVSATRFSRSARRADQIRSAGRPATRSQSQFPPSLSVSAPGSASSSISLATQVAGCTPLVMEPIGTSASSNPGHRPENISRLTAPCSLLTPLTRCASRMPITAMLKTFGSPPG